MVCSGYVTLTMMHRAAAPELSVLIPLFNEVAGLEELCERLLPILKVSVASYEVLFVDDGSQDASFGMLQKLCGQHSHVRAISLSRNFGKEIAIAAGLDYVSGQAVIIMDADLQHPPEMIPAFLAKWKEGYKNIYGQRISRTADGWLRRLLTEKFYDLFALFGEIPLPDGAGDFRLLDRQAVEALRKMGERARFSKGLYAWIGFRSAGIPMHVAERRHGTSRFTFGKLTRFALDGLMSFTTLPLRVWTFLGSLIAFLSFAAALYFFIEAYFTGVHVPGFASLIVSIMFLSGIQLISLGILGEYIGRIFAEVKGRPLYLVQDKIGFELALPLSLHPPARQSIES